MATILQLRTYIALLHLRLLFPPIHVFQNLGRLAGHLVLVLAAAAALH
jgi:hypothetical protein